MFPVHQGIPGQADPHKLSPGLASGGVPAPAHIHTRSQDTLVCCAIRGVPDQADPDDLGPGLTSGSVPAPAIL
eukprot:1161056-Pelagomonas_calceolata.AAC.1